jgi:hypothetical protein
MVSMRPTPLTLGDLIPLTVRHFDTNFGMRAEAGFRHGKRPEARCTHTQVRNGEPETTSLRENNGRRPNFFIFWPNEVLKKPS